MNVVTGAFSYTGRAIAEQLLERGERVRTLSRRDSPNDPLRGRIEVASLRFDEELVESLRGASTLYNTYWIRFERGTHTFDEAVQRSMHLFRCARTAGVERIVHVSVSQAGAAPDLPYFDGKLRVEERLAELGGVHAIVRPTLVFGAEDILVNNIAWILRRFPLFAVPGDGAYLVQPVSVADVATICIDAPDGQTVDAAGPEVFRFDHFVSQIRDAVRARARVVHGPANLALGLVRGANVLLRDVVLTPDELAGLSRSLLTSANPPLGTTRFTQWLGESAGHLGQHYRSELERNFRGQE